jgi:hypothetical protein
MDCTWLSVDLDSIIVLMGSYLYAKAIGETSRFLMT